MSFLELVKQRYSVRAYKPDRVDDSKLKQVIEAAHLAPTTANRQPFQLIVIHTIGKETELTRIYVRPWFLQAPIVICACALTSQVWIDRTNGKSYTDVDVAIVMDHLILAATDLGLGTCWIGAFNPIAAREVLGLPKDVEPIAFTPLGYPADHPKPKIRKTMSELVRYEHY
ncbi:nitroreductase family protein [Chloroflexota bacterium]